MLFSRRVRTDPRPATIETPFEFLDRGAGTHWDAIRLVLNAWFERYPAEHRPELRERLFSDDQWQSSFWELLLHELYSAAGASVQVHPDLQGSTRRPDFLVRTDTGAFLLEARVVTATTDAKRRRDRRLQTLIDTINRTPAVNFYLKLDLLIEGQDQPAAGPVIAELQPWLESLDPAQIHEQASISGLRGLPAREIATGGWKLRFTPVPVDPDKRGRLTGPLIGLRPVEMSVSDPTAAMRKALSRKGRHYGETKLPLVIALAFEEFGVEDGDIAAALHGRVTLFLSSEGDVVDQRRVDDGYWSGRRNAGSRVSAVLTARNPRPWNVAKLQLHLWLNPWAANPYASERLWMSTTADPTTGEFQQTEASTTTFGLLGIEPDWPPGTPSAA